MPERTLVWRREDVAGIEIAFVRLGPALRARGSAIATGPNPYRLWYALETRDDLTTSRFEATAEGHGWTRRIELTRNAAGRWSCDATSQGAPDLPRAGTDADALARAQEVDLGFSPLTNTPPVLRGGLLHDGPPFDLDAAWISVPDLAVERLGQRYTFLGRDGDGVTVRYENRDGSFSADLELDRDGFVLRYPGLAVLA